MMITKQQAAILFAYDYKLISANGRVYAIDNMKKDHFQLDTRFGLEISFFKNIGTDYFILARPLEQIKEDDYFDTYIELCEELEVNSCEYFIESLINNSAYTMKIKDYDTAKEFLLKNHFNINFPKEAVKLLTDNK